MSDTAGSWNELSCRILLKKGGISLIIKIKILFFSFERWGTFIYEFLSLHFLNLILSFEEITNLIRIQICKSMLNLSSIIEV